LQKLRVGLNNAGSFLFVVRLAVAPLLFSAVAMTSAASAQEVEVESIRAIVNDEVISEYDMDQRLNLILAAAGSQISPEQRELLRQQALQNLVDEKLQLQEAAEYDLVIADEEVDQTIGAIGQQYQMSPDQFRAYLERAAAIDILAFDKTGTLTYGKPKLTNVHALNSYSREAVVRIAAGAESLSEHPIALAILSAAREMNLEIEEPDEFRAVAGHGIQAVYNRDGHTEIIYIGNDKLFMDESMDLSPAIRMIGRALQRQGKTTMLVARRSTVSDTLGDDRDWEVVGYLAVADTLRENAKESIEALRAVGVTKMAMLTGDNRNVAEAIAGQAGISPEDVYAELLPEQKVEIIQQLVKEGHVAMLGDGVNDAPALATASVGIAMGAAGTDVALETADIVLMSDDLSKLPFVIGLSRKAERIVRQNLIFSLGVMLTLILLTIVAPWIVPGFRLPLPLGVVGHEGSTLIVVMNGLRMLAVRE